MFASRAANALSGNGDSGLVKRVRDWPHSSFHREVAAGIVPLDWAGDIDPAGGFGEHSA
jgi:putative transposase